MTFMLLLEALNGWCQNLQGQWSKGSRRGNIYHRRYPTRCYCQSNDALQSWPTWRSTRSRISWNQRICLHFTSNFCEILYPCNLTNFFAYLRGGVLLAMMTNLALPYRKVSKVFLYPNWNLPDFITKANLLLMDSTVFLVFFWTPMLVKDEFLEGRNDNCAPIHAKCCVEKNDRKKKFHRLVFLLWFSKDL